MEQALEATQRLMIYLGWKAETKTPQIHHASYAFEGQVSHVPLLQNNVWTYDLLGRSK